MIYVDKTANIRVVKIGKGDVPSKRLKQFQTAAPEYEEIVSFPGGIKEEAVIHKMLDSERVEGTREHFHRTRKVEEWIIEMCREHGVSEPEDRKETSLQWLRRVSLKGRNKRVRDAAKECIYEWQRLMREVPKSARGGWTLWERLWGKTRLSVSGPLLVGYDISSAVSVVSFKGKVYRFFVFVEACERAGRKPPPGALRSGMVPLNHSVPTHRKINFKRVESAEGTGMGTRLF
jgi:hypothetical protein